MKATNWFILICFLTCFFSSGQENQEYLNENSEHITKKEFLKLIKKKGFYSITQNSGGIQRNILIQRNKKGKINLALLDSIRKVISESTGQSIPTQNILVLNYYHGKDACNSSGSRIAKMNSYLDYQKGLKEFSNVSQYYLYDSSEGLQDYNSLANWIEDPDAIIKRNFFPFKYPCGSYILIDKEGNYYLHKGEYGSKYILYLLKNKRTFNLNKKV